MHCLTFRIVEASREARAENHIAAVRARRGTPRVSYREDIAEVDLTGSSAGPIGTRVVVESRIGAPRATLRRGRAEVDFVAVQCGVPPRTTFKSVLKWSLL